MGDEGANVDITAKEVSTLAETIRTEAAEVEVAGVNALDIENEETDDGAGAEVTDGTAIKAVGVSCAAIEDAVADADAAIMRADSIALACSPSSAHTSPYSAETYSAALRTFSCATADPWMSPSSFILSKSFIMSRRLSSMERVSQSASEWTGSTDGTALGHAVESDARVAEGVAPMGVTARVGVVVAGDQG